MFGKGKKNKEQQIDETQAVEQKVVEPRDAGAFTDGDIQETADINNVEEQDADALFASLMGEEAAEETAEAEVTQSTVKEKGSKYDGEQILNELHKTEHLADSIVSRLNSTQKTSLGEVVEQFTQQSRRDILTAKLIAFFGASGGVGVTTMVMETAKRLSDKGAKVLIVDICPEGSIYRNFFQATGTMLPKKDLIDLVDGDSRMEDCVLLCKGNISILSCVKRGIDSVVKFDGELSSKSFEHILDELTSVYDYILIDCGSKLENLVVNDVLYRCDRVLLVTDGGMTSLHKLVCLSSDFMFCGISRNKCKVISNKSTRNISDKLSNIGFEVAYTVPYLESIKNLQLQGSLLNNNYIYSEAKFVAGAKETFDSICADLMRSVFDTAEEEVAEDGEKSEETEGGDVE